MKPKCARCGKPLKPEHHAQCQFCLACAYAIVRAK